MPKEFKTIDELVKLLESRNVKTDEDTPRQLVRETYYAIVNGYKGPFLDRQAMQRTPGDYFKDGTEFSWMYTLLLFDRDLRALTFKYLAKAEAAMKSCTVLAFCEAHPKPDDYLKAGSYVSSQEMLLPKGFRGDAGELHEKQLSRLLRTLKAKAGNPNGRPFVAHYVKKYGFVPLWVLSNDMTFGCAARFYQLQTRAVQARACRLVQESRGDDAYEPPRLTPHDMMKAYSVFVDFRNICAHDERLYCAKVGKRQDTDYGTMCAMLALVLRRSEVESFVREVNGLLKSYEGKLHGTDPHALLGAMGLGKKPKQRQEKPAS